MSVDQDGIFEIPTPNGTFQVKAKNEQEAYANAVKAGVVITPKSASTFDMVPQLFTKAATFGASDYLGAANRTLAQTILPERGEFKQKSFSQNLADIRSKQAQYSNENPFRSVLAQIAGGVTSPLGQLIGNRVASSIPNAPQLLQYGATGAVGGGLAGAGYSEGEGGGLPSGTRLALDASIGAAFGGGAGVALPMAFQGVANALGKLRSFTSAGAQKMAVNEIMKALGRDQTSADDVAMRARGLGPDIAIADVPGIPSTQRLADAVVQQPGQSAKIYGDVADARNADRIMRLQGQAAQNITGVKFFDRWLEKIASRSRAAAPAYRKLEDTFTDLSQRSDKLSVWQGDPRVKEAYKLGVQRYANDALNEGRVPDLAKFQVTDFAPDGSPIVDKVPIQSIKQWDTVKRGLDRRLNIDKSLRDEFGRLNEDGLQLRNLRNNIRDHLDEVTTVDGKSLYKEARAAWADDSAYIESMTDGYNFMRWAGGQEPNSPMAREFALKEFNKLTEPEKEAFRIGMRQQFDEIIGRKETLPEALKQLTNPQTNLAKRVRPYFKTQNDYDSFVNSIKAEKAMIASDRRYAGSQTNTRAAAEDDLGVPADFSQAVGDMASGNPQQGAFGLLRGAWNYVNSPVLPEAARDRVGAYLLMPQNRDALVRAIMTNNTPGWFRNPLGPASLSQLSPGLLSGAAVTPGALSGTLDRRPR